MKTIISTIGLLVLVGACSGAGNEKKNSQATSALASLMRNSNKVETSKPVSAENPSEASIKCEPTVTKYEFQSREDVIIQVPVMNGDEGIYGALVEIKDSNGKLIQSGFTDKNGFYTETISVFDGAVLMAHVSAVGIPPVAKQVYPPTAETKSLQCSSGGSSAKVIQTTAFSSSGVLFRTERSTPISTKLLTDINYALPETKDIRKSHPEYILDGIDPNVKITELADVWVTFIHEGAGYRNSFGYFTYTDATKPTHPSQVNKIALFPNASFRGSGGDLLTGDRVYLGQFPAGTRIGFWVISDGWNGSSMVESKPTFFSINELNPESTSDLRKHLAMLYYENEEKIILGFEDITRTASYCDHDFNDVIFTVTANPIRAIDLSNIMNVPTVSDADKDGVADNNDPYPNDPTRTYMKYFPGYDTKSVLAFEDLFPIKGDYDFNDMVVSFRMVEVLDPNRKVKELEAEFELKAMGAGNQNGLALLIETPENNVLSSEKFVNGVSKGSAIETGHGSELVLKVIDNGRTQIQIAPGYNFANTVKGSPVTVGDKVKIKVVFNTTITDIAPYNPFLYGTRNRGMEVHLANKRPSNFFNTSLFNVGDDRSNPATNKYFVDSNGYPWAMLLGNEFSQMSERVSIREGYPDFEKWVISGGANFKTWVNNKVLSKLF